MTTPIAIGTRPRTSARAALWRRELLALPRRRPKLLALLVVAGIVPLVTALAGHPMAAAVLAWQVALFGAVVLGLAPMSGIVSEELSRGLVLFWAQKGRSVRRFYLERYLARQGAVLGAVAVLLALITAVPLVGGDVPWGTIRSLIVVVPLVALLLASIVFAMSSMGLSRDVLATLTYLLVSGLIAFNLRGRAGVQWDVARTLLFPFDGIGALYFGGESSNPWRAAATLIGQIIAWSAIGWYVVDRAARARLAQGSAT
ncbi:MAG: hypothetical protein MUF00_05650 [Gemmatimonadaceae bacterium]|jgi:hypothetical protein|nr:hypothetical protein [Gemmatimonadaceae bacterium]